MINKTTTILLLLFLSFLSVSYSQEGSSSQHEVIIEQNIYQNSMTLSFDNQKEFNENRLEVFKSRLINYYSELDDIQYTQDTNRFTLVLNVTEMSKNDLDGILTHFNVYNYSIDTK